MQKNQLRTVLVVVILLLVGVIGLILAKRGAAANTPVRVATGGTAEPRAPDNAMARIQRAGAVTAIERGDYKSAIAALSSIVKAGNGVGDEVELLRMAKELDEKYRKPTAVVEVPAVGGGGADVVDEPERAPAIVPKPGGPAPKPAAPVRKPVTAAPPPRPVVVARVTPPEPATGLLLVTSVPTGLSVEIDGKRSEFTPLRKLLEVGPHQVVIFRRDEAVFRRTVIVPKDGVATVDADLTPEKPTEPEPRPTPVEPKPATVEPKPASAEPKPLSSSSEPISSRVEPPRPATPANPSDVGEVLVLQAGLVGDVFIQGVGYGPPPVLAKSVPAGEVSVELRADGSVKRKKTVVVEKGRRTNVQFR